jgi:hypothetical protein
VSRIPSGKIRMYSAGEIQVGPVKSSGKVSPSHAVVMHGE